MKVYYNENDPFASDWLCALIAAGVLPDGDVDDRSIEDVVPTDLADYDQCHFFAGIGGWAYALQLAGWPDDRPVWTGSCPCQPFSAAGQGAGFADERHLWPSWFHLIEQCRPPVVCGEQVEKAITFGWLDLVQDDLERENYAFAAIGIPAASIGTPHARHRLYWVGDVSDTYSLRSQRSRQTIQSSKSWPKQQFTRLVQDSLRVSVPSGQTGGLVDGVPNSLDQLRGYGNAIVPQVAQAFIEAYMSCRGIA